MISDNVHISGAALILVHGHVGALSYAFSALTSVGWAAGRSSGV